MTKHTWDFESSVKRIQTRLAEVQDISVVPYTRVTDLQSIATNKAYLVDAVHIYIDIINTPQLFDSAKADTEYRHKLVLKFLNRHVRAIQRLIDQTGDVLVDMHNQRLHAFVAKPYDSDENDREVSRIEHAVAISQLVIDVLKETGDDDAQIENAKVSVGIDSGKALAVNNGRRGYREPLFLGNPANKAAKMLEGNRQGIFLTNNARVAVGLNEVDRPAAVPLTAAEVATCVESANLGITAEQIIELWKADLKAKPTKNFQFSRHTPPMAGLDFADLTPSTSRRMEVVSVYADIDGFTAFINDAIEASATDEEGLEDAVKALHVLRSELDAVLAGDFEGKKVRFIGDCIHGVLAEGTSIKTDDNASADDAVYCTAALHSGFNLASKLLQDDGIDTSSLGLQVGLEYGVTALTRLGMKGRRIPCVLSTSVIESEEQQKKCSAGQTAIGKMAYSVASEPIQKLFKYYKATDLDFSEMCEQLAEQEDAKKVEAPPSILTSSKTSDSEHFRPHNPEFRPHASMK